MREIITDKKQLSDKRFIKGLRYGVYVMQNSKHPEQFVTGALGTWDKYNPWLGKIQQCDSALRRLTQYVRLALGWQYVFFTKDTSSDHIYSMEAMLHGRLSETFRATGKSYFITNSPNSVRQVQHIASDIMNHPEPSPSYLFKGVEPQSNYRSETEKKVVKFGSSRGN